MESKEAELRGLSDTQLRAVQKLTDEWQTPYDLQESISTLDSLVCKDIAEERQDKVGYFWSPRTSIYYRRKGKVKHGRTKM